MNNQAWESTTNHRHADMDDMGEWAENNPMIKRAYIPQGCDYQGRLVPTIKSAEPFPVIRDYAEDDDQSESADGDVLRFLAIVMVSICGALSWANVLAGAWGAQ
jgi:hypothetical protein